VPGSRPQTKFVLSGRRKISIRPSSLAGIKIVFVECFQPLRSWLISFAASRLCTFASWREYSQRWLAVGIRQAQEAVAVILVTLAGVGEVVLGHRIQTGCSTPPAHDSRNLIFDYFQQILA